MTGVQTCALPIYPATACGGCLNRRVITSESRKTVYLHGATSQIQTFLKRPDIEAQLKDRGVIRVGNSPAEFRTIMNDEYTLFQNVIKQTGVKAE